MQTYISVIGVGTERKDLNDLAYEVGKLIAGERSLYSTQSFKIRTDSSLILCR